MGQLQLQRQPSEYPPQLDSALSLVLGARWSNHPPSRSTNSRQQPGTIYGARSCSQRISVKLQLPVNSSSVTWATNSGVKVRPFLFAPPFVDRFCIKLSVQIQKSSTARRGCHGALECAGLQDLGNLSRSLVQKPASAEARDASGLRFLVGSPLDGRSFETFHLDIGWGDPVVEPAEKLTAPSLLVFADIASTVVPCCPVTQHVAEKVHAYTRPQLIGEGSRVKDLMDILLIARMRAIDGAILLKALQATFEARKTHLLPLILPDPPATWAAPFRRLAGEVGLECDSLADGAELAHRFVDPVLQRRARGLWDPHGWQWPD